MTRIRTAYLPLTTFPDVAPDDAIGAAIRVAQSLGHALHATSFAVEIPQIISPLGGLFLDVPEMVRVAEEKSRTNCIRLQALVGQALAHPQSDSAVRTVIFGTEIEAAATEARAFDLSLLAWGAADGIVRELAQAVIFESGRPAILVPATTQAAPLEHIAIAWDGSRVAARALGDALTLLPESGRVSVLTVRNEKPLADSDLAASLQASLKKRRVDAAAVDVPLDGRPVALALQQAAISSGAGLLAMGGFGHSRLRDFVLGGATQGVLQDLRLPVLMSH